MTAKNTREDLQVTLHAFHEIDGNDKFVSTEIVALYMGKIGHNGPGGDGAYTDHQAQSALTAMATASKNKAGRPWDVERAPGSTNLFRCNCSGIPRVFPQASQPAVTREDILERIRKNRT